MNLGRFIPNNIKTEDNLSFSGTATKFAGVTIVVGIFTLVMAFSILNGFKSFIGEMVYEYNGHYEIGKIGGNTPLRTDSGFYKTYQSNFPEIEKVRAVSYLGCIIQHNESVEGVVIKGYDSTGISDMNRTIVAGSGIGLDKEREVLISETVSNKMGLKVGDKFVANFFDGKVKYRKLQVRGVFKTNLSEFDEKMIIAPVALVTKLVRWKDNEVAGFEVLLKPEIDSDVFYDDFRFKVGYDLEVLSTKVKFIHLFAWLKNLDQNVMLLIVILFILVLFSIVSTMYILVFEKNQMVGVLKSLGASDSQILSVFRSIGLKIGVVGLVIGNVLAYVFMFVQKKYKILTLNPEHYYLDYIPVEINWSTILMINVISVLTILLILSIPYFVIVKMRPVENLRFS